MHAKSYLRLVYSEGSNKSAPSKEERRSRWAIVGAVCAAVLGVAIFRNHEAAGLFANYSSILTWLTVVVGAGAIHHLYKDDLKLTTQSNYFKPAIIAALVTGFLFYSVGTGNRFNDESNLYRDARAMHQGQVINGNPEPRLFAFATNVMHSLFGFSPNHGFWVNFICAMLLTLLIIRVGDHRKERSLGVIGAICLASFPLYALSATSGSADIMNALLVAAVGYQTYRFFEHPELVRWELTLILTLLAAQCNPVSAVLLIPCAAMAIIERKKIFAERATLRTFVLPILALPLVWSVIANNSLSNVSNFNFDKFIANFGGVVTFLVNNGNNYTVASQIFTLLALVGCALIAMNYRRIQQNEPTRNATYVFVGGLALITLAQYGFNNNYSNGGIARTVLVYLPLLAILAAIPLHRLYDRSSGAPAMITMLLVANLCYQVPNNSRGNYSRITEPNIDYRPVLTANAQPAAETRRPRGRVGRAPAGK
jgi:hypothetical protein